MRASSAAGAPFDQGALATKLDELGDRLEALVDQEPPESSGPASSPQERTADMVKTVMDGLAPLIALAATKLGPPPLAGGGGGTEPSGGESG
jgi:hypothetical protein